ncbi:hypothetical protein BC828DRAFT_372826 [Blastocladiella britannica]|nr:hypothetical protein BC828DRAFT_372826 [Blastocladiella britannica]
MPGLRPPPTPITTADPAIMDTTAAAADASPAASVSSLSPPASSSPAASSSAAQLLLPLKGEILVDNRDLVLGSSWVLKEPHPPAPLSASKSSESMKMDRLWPDDDDGPGNDCAKCKVREPLSKHPTCSVYGCPGCQRLDCELDFIECEECHWRYHWSCAGIKELGELDPEYLPADPEGGNAYPPFQNWYCPRCTNNQSISNAGHKSKGKAFTSGKKLGGGHSTSRIEAGISRLIDTPTHRGAVPGLIPGQMWMYRNLACSDGAHRDTVAGISTAGEYGVSIVLGGGYATDRDYGSWILYTASGGTDLGGDDGNRNRRVAQQTKDQEEQLTGRNLRLARTCAGALDPKVGCDAGGGWRASQPVRVMRSAKARLSLNGHEPSRYAPLEGISYDGIYKVVRVWRTRSPKTDRFVWQYLLRRDDPTPEPWTRAGLTFIDRMNLKPVYFSDVGHYPTRLAAFMAEQLPQLNGGASSTTTTKSKRALTVRSIRELRSRDPVESAQPPLHLLGNLRHAPEFADVPYTCGGPRSVRKAPPPVAERVPLDSASDDDVSDVDIDEWPLPDGFEAAIAAEQDQRRLEWTEAMGTLPHRNLRCLVRAAVPIYECQLSCGRSAVRASFPPCGHLMCAPCWRKYARLERSETCPSCGVEHGISTRAADLPTDDRAAAVLAALGVPVWGSQAIEDARRRQQQQGTAPTPASTSRKRARGSSSDRPESTPSRPPRPPLRSGTRTSSRLRVRASVEGDDADEMAEEAAADGDPSSSSVVAVSLE